MSTFYAENIARSPNPSPKHDNTKIANNNHYQIVLGNAKEVLNQSTACGALNSSHRLNICPTISALPFDFSILNNF